MRMRRRTAASALLVLLALPLAGCAPSVFVRRGQDAEEERPIENAAVLLFRKQVAGCPPHLDELATDAFSLELKKYFPALVDRYQVAAFLRARGIPEAEATAPHVLRAIGEELGADGLFVGTVTGYGETRSFLGWNERPHFFMECRLLSTREGRVLLAGRASITESVPLPVEDTKQMAVYGVRSLIARMRLDERLGPPVLTREDPAWRRAMRAYERRRFWEAAEAFGAIVAGFRPGDLREEARLYQARSLEELGFEETARAVYEGMRAGPFAAAALVRLAERALRAGEGETVLRLADEIAARFPGSPEEGAARYLGGSALARAGRTREAIALFAAVPEESAWRRFARYALAEAHLRAGDESAARAALEEAGAPGGGTESERRLRGRALLALGDLHHRAGRLEEADACFARVEGEEEARASLARGWVAAERDRFGEAIELLAAARVSEDPRLAAEALLLDGSCRARLGLWSEAAAVFREALAACAAWEAAGARGADLARERGEALRELSQEIKAHEGAVLGLLPAGDAGGESALRALRRRHETLTLRVERIEASVPRAGDPESETAARAAIRERADFSLAQALFESGRGETRETAALGGAGGNR
ncbi:MAG: tetratricopeptide repeat protein [Candidatus Eisenbacteria bacterium]|nr:tetratricopeptide repeat protein [Candidatus Eisenbacteria bacterium]